MSTTTEQKPAEFEFVNPDTGEVLDKRGYCSYLGIDPNFRITDEASLEWYQKEHIEKQAVVDAIRVQYKRVLSAAENEIKSLEFHFKADAEVVHEQLTIASGKQTHHTPYASFHIKHFKTGTWKIKNEDSLQTWLRFVPDEDLECVLPDGEVLTIPGKKNLGVRPTMFTRDLEQIKKLVELRRVKELELHALMAAGQKVDAVLVRTVEVLKDALPNDALEYTPPHTTKSMSFPKAGGDK